MFILCPHCQFLVSIDPASGLPPAQCPRCGKALVQPAGNAAPASAAPVGANTSVAPASAPHETREAVKPAGNAAPASATPVEANTSVAPANAPHETREADARQSTSAQPPRVQPDAAATEAPGAVATAPFAKGEEKTPAAETAAEETPPAVARPARTPRRRSTPRAAAPAAVAPEPSTNGSSPAAEEAVVTADVAEDLAGASAARVEGDGPDVGAAQSATDAAPAATAGRQRRAPSFAHAARSATRPPRWRALAAIFALALLLVLQVLLADRAALAADARWRPLVASLCGVLRCALPAWHEPAAYTLLARDVRPARPGVLHVSASFRNDARWPQAWPLLHLALQDVDGRTVGARTLTPAEYRGRAPITQNSVATGQVANIAFDIAEPSATVVAFTFDFR